MSEPMPAFPEPSPPALEVDDGTYISHTSLLPAHFHLKYMTSLIFGGLAGTLTAFATNVVIGVAVGVLTCVVLWRLSRMVLRPRPPIDRMRVIAVNTRNFTVTPMRSKEVIARKSIGDYDRYEFKPGYGRWWPARFTLYFDDGEVWRGESGLGMTDVSAFARALNEA